MRADLHTHSCASDGRLRPAELVTAAYRVGLNVIAITDHDCVEGIDPALEAARNLSNMTVIPGVEVSTDVPRGEVHILGYFIDHHDPGLLTTLEKLRASRLARAQKMVAKLGELGLPVDWDRVLEFAGDGAIGRPHIAQAMLERCYITSLREAFDKYLGRQGPAYVEREKITPSEAVQLIVKASGLPVLAHPADIEGLEQMIPKLQKAGLIGIEVYYGGYPAKVKGYLASLCQKFNLIPCGGSDYHGLDESNETPLGGVGVPEDGVRQLFALAEERDRIASGVTQPPHQPQY